MKIAKAVPFDNYHFDDVYLNFIDKLFIKPKHERPNFNQRMFDEDFASIFCPTSRRSGNFFNVETNNNELLKRLFDSLKTRYGSRNIDKKIRELVEEIAQSLISTGTAFYFLHDSLEENDICISSIRARGFFRFLNMYFQWIPKRYENYWDHNDKVLPRELRILNKTKLIRIIMPKSIGQMLSKQNRTLAILDKHQLNGTEFYHKATHENPNPKNNFDFRVWHNTQEQVLYRATRETGWNGRKYDSSKRSDFFICHRLIRFRMNQLILRDHILHQLSNEFTKLGRQYDATFNFSISPTNILPKVDELNDLEAQLFREEVSFAEVLDYCHER